MTGRRPNRQRLRSVSGFSLIEVGIAVAVLALTATSSIVAMKAGFSMIEMSRDNTLASQILQSEMENLRLKSWDQLTALGDGNFNLEETFSEVVARRFSGGRVVRQPEDGLREVTLYVEWKTSKGQEMNRQYISYFSRSGLNDYYYRAFH